MVVRWDIVLLRRTRRRTGEERKTYESRMGGEKQTTENQSAREREIKKGE